MSIEPHREAKLSVRTAGIAPDLSAGRFLCRFRFDRGTMTVVLLNDSNKVKCECGVLCAAGRGGGLQASMWVLAAPAAHQELALGACGGGVPESRT